jgi:hypothetical protein
MKQRGQLERLFKKMGKTAVWGIKRMERQREKEK